MDFDFSDLPLTKRQMDFYKTLVDGLDEQLLVTIDWLESVECKELWNKNQVDIDEFWNKLELKQYLDDITTSNAGNAQEYAEEFYKIGKDLSMRELNKFFDFTSADKQALFFVKEYNFELVKNVNNSLANGIRSLITEQILTGRHPTEMVDRLLNLPFNPLDTKISVQSRCLFIARTESARAINTGTLQTYEQLGVTEVEIITSHAQNVCDICKELESKSPYPLKEGMSLLPAHVNCCCSYAAVTDTIEEPPKNPRIINTTPV